MEHIVPSTEEGRDKHDLLLGKDAVTVVHQRVLLVLLKWDSIQGGSVSGGNTQAQRSLHLGQSGFVYLQGRCAVGPQLFKNEDSSRGSYWSPGMCPPA